METLFNTIKFFAILVLLYVVSMLLLPTIDVLVAFFWVGFAIFIVFGAVKILFLNARDKSKNKKK